MNRGIWTILMVGTLLVAGCDDSDPAAPPAEVVLRVEVAPDEAWLEPGDTVRLTATAWSTTGKLVTGRTVTWDTGDPSRVAVTASGSTALVTALQAGFASVTAMVDGKQGDATVLVEAALTGSIEVTPAQATLMVGEEMELEAVVRSQTGELMDAYGLSWSLDDVTVAELTATGEPGRIRVRALAQGTTLIMAERDDVVTGMALQVLPVSEPAGAMDVSPEALTVEVNKTIPLRAWVWSQDGAPIDDPVVTWTSSDPTVAMVAGHAVDGRADLVARAPGVVTIRALSGGKTDSARITVVAPPVVESVYLGNRTVWEFSTVGFEATVVGPGGILADAPVAWSAEDPTVADIDARGFATGLRAGSTRIWAESGGIRGSATLTVRSWPADGKVRLTMQAHVDPWGTPRILGSMGATTWTDSTGAVTPASLWLVGGSVDFHGDGRYTRILEVDVKIPGFGGILVTVERRTLRTTGEVAYDFIDAWTFHLLPGGSGPGIRMELFEPGAWTTQEKLGDLPALPFRWNMP